MVLNLVARRFRNGVYFIDRDGELFAYVLDYLRTGKLLLPECFRELARLREEVEFYRLEPLMHQLMPYYNLKYPVCFFLWLLSTCQPNQVDIQSGGNRKEFGKTIHYNEAFCCFFVLKLWGDATNKITGENLQSKSTIHDIFQTGEGNKLSGPKW